MEHILTLFEDTVNRFPDRTAVACRDRSYTFACLKDRALALAARIRREAQTETTSRGVAVLVDRDADTLILFLAALYTGGFYVPIDPEMPLAKQQSILADSRPEFLLCSSRLRDQAEALSLDQKVLTPEDSDLPREAYFPGDESAAEESMPPRREEDPIYMVYTSGSTGKPKGVLKSHRAVCSFIRAYSETFGLGSEEIIGNQTPFFFDASAKDIYLSLYTGATLEVIPSDLFMFPPNLITYLNERRVSFICWVPTALAMVTQINTFRQVMPEYLRNVFFVGEVFPIKQLRRWVEALPQIRFVNLYGSTELAGISCYYTIDNSAPAEILPMGKALSNCRVFLYDNAAARVITDTDTVGEVCVVSDALALEYYNDPEKTAAVFVTMEAAVPGLPGEGTVRVLKTGDLARYDGKGDLVFSSRSDFQIKHMGRRIELGEIETVADRLPQIQRCCCLYDSERKKIRLFCELTPGCSRSGKEIREELRSHLSDYMVPNVVKVLEKLPLNANGKIDRTALKSM